MPELPEVETVKNGITPHILNTYIEKATLYRQKLRFELDPDFVKKLTGQKILQTSRRGKHLIIKMHSRNLIIHLGMSGTLQITDKQNYHIKKHDHIVLTLSNQNVLFFNDPRRFGYWHICDEDPLLHSCFKNYGPEPLSNDFDAAYLFDIVKSKKQTIKSVIMNNNIVTGVGNIYACESLFHAAIKPTRLASALNYDECKALCQAIKNVLQQAITQGGTTLKDYKNAQGKPGYFSQSLYVYGKKGMPCLKCQSLIESLVIAQRNTFFCQKCQR
ncbi:bifunctional DNA-formamidopyrimidine glycosylase/DNA-(apurinic or apyrimidinic site) lyase [Facilibium subflavum]|uniref:bifunctional DNA-formamidopyrimidine glycosylase/DNA-(apurinic or apyrimidinic site) lyase n=1 Tax=Facilibium subflavum TaxID=2219058 RepID=UPI000E649A07|nr:bifunctional DNA-formamidopyrimidine glycosylase/DNA-(apurinic or apyrimidinic site) lyase [Facilibium subflavum]